MPDTKLPGERSGTDAPTSRCLLLVRDAVAWAGASVSRMPVDVEAARQFVLGSARLLDRHRLAVLLDDGPAPPVLHALRAYQNADGGFGHALEPDVRAPESEPAATLHALDVLLEVGAYDEPMVAQAAGWVATIAQEDGGLPFVMPTSAGAPHAPWMVPSNGGSHLTFAVAARLWELDSHESWLEQATDWCWAKLDGAGDLGGYWLKFGLEFLDSVPDGERAASTLDGLRSRLAGDGSIPVAGGTEDERLTPLTLSPRPNLRSRALFTDDQIDADLDALEQGQQSDGGWLFDWLAWSPGQAVEWRGAITLRALATLKAHQRLP